MAVAVAELLSVYVSVLAGLLMHAVLAAALVTRYAAHPGRFPLPALALPSLLRVLSLTVPVPVLSMVVWPAMVGVPLIVAAMAVLRALSVGPAAVGLGRVKWLPQLLIGASGVPLSLAVFLASGVPSLGPPTTSAEILLVGLSSFAFVGFAEELVFRGVLQGLLVPVIGRVAIILVSIVYGFMYAGTLSLDQAVTMGLIGAMFGYVADFTESIWGTSLAHGLMVLGAVLLWPALLT